MSGALVPYHLRQNKAVDRQLFVELLQRIHRYEDVGNYIYVGFAGLFFEDFKAMHSVFGIKKLISLETDKVAYKRQCFNRPLTCIRCQNQSSSDYISGYTAKRNSIHWLDYASPNEIRSQLQDMETLASKLEARDILKITLNANPDSLCPYGKRDREGAALSREETHQRRLANLKSRIGDYLPAGCEPDQMTAAELPRVLSLAARNAVIRGTEGTGLSFQPLCSFSYADSGHQMLTLSGIFLPQGESINFLKITKIDKWKFANLDWGHPHSIRIPVLTLKERLYIDQNLPKWSNTKKAIRAKVILDGDSEKNQESLLSYITYYRHFPNFQRVLI